MFWRCVTYSAIVTDDIVPLLQYDKLQSSMEKTYSTARICNQNGTNCDLSLEPCKRASALSMITEKFFLEGQPDPDMYLPNVMYDILAAGSLF